MPAQRRVAHEHLADRVRGTAGVPAAAEGDGLGGGSDSRRIEAGSVR
ncbi:hypothetical protein ACPPVO_19305 [Dactylosporangium sp. McL0621]